MRFPGFIGGSYQMRSIVTDCQRCINLYVDLDEMGTAKEGEVGALLGTPGTTLLCTLPTSPVRGTYTSPINGRTFAVAGNSFYELLTGGTSYALLGTLLTSTGTVGISDNGIMICIVDGAYGYSYNFAETNLLAYYLFSVTSGVTASIGAQYSNNANTFTVAEQVLSMYNVTVNSASATVGAVYKDQNTNNQFTVLGTISSGTNLMAYGLSAPTLNYQLTVSSANATAGATYVDPLNNSFTVQSTITGGLTLNVYGITAPSGSSITLNKTSGTGDAVITVTAVVALGNNLLLMTPTPGSTDVNNTTIVLTAYASGALLVCYGNGAPTNGATTLTLLSGIGQISISATASTTANAIPWLPIQSYSKGQIIVPVSNGYQYLCTTGGISGATIPTFPTTRNATVSDGTVIWTRISTFSQILDPGFLGSNVVAFQDGYFIFAKPGTNQVYNSNLNAVTFNGLNFLNLSGSSAPILNVVSLHRNLYIQTTKTTEVYYDAGISPGFPFARINGGYLEQGLAAQFSLAQTANAIFWLGQDKSGNGIVYTTSTFLPQRISTFAIEDQFEEYSTIADAIGYTYTEGGHSFYVLNFPTAQKTWVFDISTNLWHERAYNSNGQLVMQLGIYHTFGQGIHIVGDYSSGNIYQMSQDIYSDNGTPIIRKRIAPHLAKDMLRIFYSSFQLDIQQGDGLDGSVQGSSPICMLRFSDDGGRNWSNIKTASIGAIGQTKQRVFFRRLGQARDRVFEVTISDPVFVAIVGAELYFDMGDS